MGHGTGFRGPLRYRKVGGHLDECLLRFADTLSLIPTDDEHIRVYGVANDCLETPTVTIGAGTGITPYTVASGSANAATVPGLQAALGGVFRIQTAATADNDSAILRLGNGGGTNPGPFKRSATLRQWFSVRLALQNVGAGECTVGLVNAVYNPADFATLPTDGVFFTKAVAGTDFTFHVRKASTSTTIANVLAAASVTVPLANDVFVELSFFNDGGVISVFVNGIKLTTGIASGDANLPLTSTALALFIGNATSAAATRYMDLDHFVAASER